MKTNYNLVFLIGLLYAAGAQGQQLSLGDAIQKALESNYQIQVQENLVEVADNSVHIGNAGLLPTVSARGSYNASVTSSKQVFAGGFPPVDVDGAGSQTMSASASLNYNLFNGLAGINNFARLKINKASVDAQSKAAIETLILQVCQSYLSLQRAQDQLSILEANLAVTNNRYERAKVANELGSNNKTELLNARVALTADSAQLLQAELLRTTQVHNLERLLGQDLGLDIRTVSEELIMRSWTLEAILEEAQKHNAGLEQRRMQTELAEKDLAIQRANFMPTLALTAGYGYNKNINDVGILLENTSIGPNAGLTLSVPIFGGMRNQIQRQNLKIAVENAELLEADAQLALTTQVRNAEANYSQSLRIFLMEEQNLEAAELNLERSTELFQLGQITQTQFREAQLNMVATRDRISAAKVNVLLSELQILQLTGKLLGE